MRLPAHLSRMRIMIKRCTRSHAPLRTGRVLPADLTFRIAVPLVVLALLIAGCGDDADGDSQGNDVSESKVSVVAAIFPLAEVAREVGAEFVEVRELGSPGVEPHDLELTTDQVDDVLEADLVLAMGRGFQPGVEETARTRSGETLLVLETDEVTERVAAGETGGDEAVGAMLVDDPHVWLDPLYMEAVVGAVSASLGAIDPDHRSDYEAGGRRFARELRELDARFDRTLATCERRTIVSAHEAFGWMTRRYGLDQLALAGISPELEPDPRQLADLADRMRDEGMTTVFAEPSSPEGVAEALAREAGAKVATLDPLEVSIADEHGARAGYVAVMEANLAALRDALGCRAT